jgi:hypothetical protein
MRRIGIILTCLLVAGLTIGCIYNPADAIKGGTTKIVMNDPATGNPTASFEHNGDVAALKGLTLHLDKDTYARLGVMNTDDTALGTSQGQAFIAQQQAYLAGTQSAIQLLEDLIGKFGPVITPFLAGDPATVAAVQAYAVKQAVAAKPVRPVRKPKTPTTQPAVKK